MLSADFDGLYSRIGRPSIPPEKLLRALLLQAFYSIRSKRQLMEQMDYNLLFHWFVGLAMDAPIWDVTVFTKNRESLLSGEVAAKLLSAIISQTRVQALLSDDHFSVDGTLIEACASVKSFRPRDEAGPGDGDDGGSLAGQGEHAATPSDRNAGRDFRGEKRRNATHASTTDPDARLFKKARGQAAKLCHMAHVLMENRNGLAVDAILTHATGTAEREAALTMLERMEGHQRITLGRTRTTTPPPSSRRCARCALPSTSLRTTPTGVLPSTGARHAIPATASPRRSASGSRRCSDGRRLAAPCERP